MYQVSSPTSTRRGLSMRPVLALAVGMMVALTACSAPGAAPAASETQAAATATAATSGTDTADVARTIIDVRTPEEFAQGHLEGAINIDLNSADFKSQIEALDKNGTYTLYCRSGNRSGQALTIMSEAGFANLSNAGSVQEASEALGLPIVTE